MNPQKLLIIEDSLDIQELVRAWLADEPIQIFSSYTGEDAMATTVEMRPDLILLDVDLPGQDGFEVCRRLKASDQTVEIPVVFLTGASSTEEKLRGLELGAADYITKPFDPAELRARVRASLNTRRLSVLLAEKAQTLQESEERFRVLAENSSDVISRLTPAGIYLYASPAAGTILGYRPEQIIGRSLFEFVHPDDVGAVRKCFSSALAPGETCSITFRFLRRDGQYAWLEYNCRTLIDSSDRSVREIHASARDISLRKEMEYREQTRAEVLEMIAQSQPLKDILTRLIEAAERQESQIVAAGVMLDAGVMHHCAPHLPPLMASSIERQLYHFIARFSAAAAETTERVIVGDLLNDPSWAELQPEIQQSGFQSCWSILIRSRHRDACGIFSLYRRDNRLPYGPAVEILKLASDLIPVAVEHRQLTDQLSFQARHDALTRLPNRLMFSDRLEQGLSLSARSGRPVGLLLVDVDRFKHVNDTYGHQAGDELLCQVAHRLGARLRQSDVLARMGGDEFAIILFDLGAPLDAEVCAATLTREFANPIELQGRKQSITISIGSAVYPRDGTDPTSLMKHADLALYRAKDAGRNTSRSFTSEMREDSASRLEFEGELREAVVKGELRLHYQPKVDRLSRIVGVEALVRWEHPKLGMVPPAKFIPLAEDTGIIVQIGQWVLQEAARQNRCWREAGFGNIQIAVNVSALQFAEPDFIRVISETLFAAGSHLSWLELELTETLLMKNIRDAVDKLAELRAMNVTVAIDDFGTGYSSLAYLQRLSLDTLKIDHSFVRTIGSPGAHDATTRASESGRIIVNSIVALAKSLGLGVVAEGIETETQREFMLQSGCELMQGYLFSPPRPPEQIEEMLHQQSQSRRAPLALSA
jgi:diguanylate cyclase (GGDEF)-like protein/PAS domain S-box-containing protein